MNRKQFIIGLLTLPITLYGESKTERAILVGRQMPKLRYGLLDAASKSFEAMKKEAKKKGVHLHITSAYRGYEKQLAIWNGKYNKFSKEGLKGIELLNKITEYSAMPGTSRHHWGTDADILDLSVTQPISPLEQKHYTSDLGIYNRLYEWMRHNSSKYDFYEAYTNDPSRQGYKFEPWHYSYQPISTNLLKSYNNQIQASDIKSSLLKGNDHITTSFFKNYKETFVNGVNKHLK